MGTHSLFFFPHLYYCRPLFVLVDISVGILAKTCYFSLFSRHYMLPPLAYNIHVSTIFRKIMRIIYFYVYLLTKNWNLKKKYKIKLVGINFREVAHTNNSSCNFSPFSFFFCPINCMFAIKVSFYSVTFIWRIYQVLLIFAWCVINQPCMCMLLVSVYRICLLLTSFFCSLICFCFSSLFNLCISFFTRKLKRKKSLRFANFLKVCLSLKSVDQNFLFTYEFTEWMYFHCSKKFSDVFCINWLRRSSLLTSQISETKFICCNW